MIQVGQIGVGYWGPNILRNLIGNRDCWIKTVVDMSEERCAYVKRLYPSIQTGTSPDMIFNDPDIEALVIVTPAFTHFDLTMKALDAGKHVLVEKPMAQSVDQIDQIGQLAKKRGRVAMVGHTFLYNASVRYLKQIVDQGKLGDIHYIYSQRLNLGRIRADTDALWTLAPHDVSIIQYLLGDMAPVSVTKQGMGYVQEKIHDVVFMNLVYPNKVIANVHVSWLDPRRVRQMTVVGSKKMVVYDDTAENQIVIYDKGIERLAILGENMDYDRPNFNPFTYRSGDVVMPAIKYEEPLRVEIAHFVDCIQNHGPCLTGTEHARSVVRILSQAKSVTG